MSKGQRRTILSEDGELREAADDADSLEPVYCTRCGTANPPESAYCRKCGHSLEEQAADVLGMKNFGRAGLKGKHDRLAMEEVDDTPVRAPAKAEPTTSANAAVAQIMTMLLVAGMGITALIMQSGEALIPIAIGWISVEAIHGGNRAISSAQALVRIFTLLLVAALTITALITMNAVATIPLMIGWIAIEGIRNG